MLPQSPIPNPYHMHLASLATLIQTALAEDLGAGDITSTLLIPELLEARMRLVAKEPLVAAGISIAAAVFAQADEDVHTTATASDGDALTPGACLLEATGNARSLLAAERTALNLLQRASGVATLTRLYVEAVAGTRAIILDTRKTIPGLRLLDKYAVTCGGGKNHRLRLDDMVLIKDNHIALAGSVTKAVEMARRGEVMVPIVVECDTLEQVEEALPLKPDRILLDNMTLDQLRQAVHLSASRVPLEASGGVSLDTVRAIAETGVDYISVGKLTHSAPAADISAEIVIMA